MSDAPSDSAGAADYAPATWQAEMADCGCTVWLGDVVLPPYSFSACTVVLLFLLTYLFSLLLWHCGGIKCERPDRPSLEGAFGTLALGNAAFPPILFVVPQALLQLGSFAVQARHERALRDDGDLSGWQSYQALYARWISSGASALMLSGAIGGVWTHQLLKHHVSQLSERGATNLYDIAAVPSSGGGGMEVLGTDDAVAHELRVLRELDVVDEKGALRAKGWAWAKRQCCNLMVCLPLYIAVLPALLTNVIPALLMWCWLVIPLLLVFHFVIRCCIIKLKAPLFTRLALLQLGVLAHVAVFQALYNWSALLYDGENYIAVIHRDWELRSMRCYLCMMQHSAAHFLAGVSFL